MQYCVGVCSLLAEKEASLFLLHSKPAATRGGERGGGREAACPEAETKRSPLLPAVPKCPEAKLQKKNLLANFKIAPMPPLLAGSQRPSAGRGLAGCPWRRSGVSLLKLPLGTAAQ